ncbi:ABC transporter family substrate-binding protein [Kitasatospora herbaricolor]|uniref:ABC transporter family substrate-binding protein n=1 Tax=Kitasatospora herbaricolor TaxID=68217 RepID=A0ABZ1W892_9ACTN|nr:ABC transporter family substrate-binding protein [Kitasatospora herbaricolor]
MRARQITAAAAALLLTGMLAGCSDDPAPTAVAAWDVSAADRAQVREGGTLRWAVDAVPSTLNVYQPAATADSELIARAVLPSLFRFDEHARPTADPDYLLSAESTPAGQTPQVVTYRLNPKAVWSDGTPISVADFTAQRSALAGANPAYQAARPAGYDAIDSITQGAGPGEVKVTFKQPYGQWRALFGPLYPASATGSPEAFNQPLAGEFHTSGGPFLLADYDRTAGRAALVRNPKWWGDAPKAERIDFLATPAAARLDALDQGKLDIAALTEAVDRAGGPEPAVAQAAATTVSSASAVPSSPAAASASASAPSAAAAPPDSAGVALAVASAQALKRAESLPGLSLHRAAAPALTELTLNASRAPLTDPAVRRALARAVDRRKIADAALTPLGLPATPLGNHLLAVGQDGYQDNSGAAGDTPATRLLDEAGWKSAGSGTRTKDGKELSLTLLLPEGSATARRTAEALTADLAGVGVALHSKAVPVDSFVSGPLAAGDFDLALFSWPATASPATDERAVYAKPQPGPDGAPRLGSNYARTGTAEIDLLFDRAAAELDPAEERSLLQQADARIWELGHSVPLYQRPDLVAVRNGVAGAGAYGFARPRYQDLGFLATT